MMTEHSSDDVGKFIAVRMLLEDLALRGCDVTQVLEYPEVFLQIIEDAGIVICSFVAMTRELCAQYNLEPVEFEVLESGTSNQANVVVRARHGHVQRIAVALTKQKATQLAAEQIYKYLHSSVSGARSFDEVEAMIRAYTRARAEVAEEEAAQRRVAQLQKMQATQEANELKKNQTLAVQAAVRLEQEDNAMGLMPQDAQGGKDLDMTYIKDIMKKLEQ